MGSAAKHQMGHDPERDAVYLAALTGIIANPQFFGAIHQGHPGAAVVFADSAVAEAFGDSPTDHAESDLVGSLKWLVEIIRKAGVNNLSTGVQLGQTSWAIKAHDALERADRAIAKFGGQA